MGCKQHSSPSYSELLVRVSTACLHSPYECHKCHAYMCVMSIAYGPNTSACQLLAYIGIVQHLPVPSLCVHQPHACVCVCVCVQAKKIVKTVVSTRQEAVEVKMAEAREPWTLPNSIFKPRAKEADARNYHDTPQVRDTHTHTHTHTCLTQSKMRPSHPLWIQKSESVDYVHMCMCMCASPCVCVCVCVCVCAQSVEKMFERDWQRACGKEKFTSMMAREHKSNTKAAGKDDKAMLQEVHDVPLEV